MTIWPMIGDIGAVAFGVLIVVTLVAKTAWSKSRNREQSTETSETILGALGGPGVYRDYQARAQQSKRHQAPADPLAGGFPSN